MIAYWIVSAMVICALGAVVVATASSTGTATPRERAPSVAPRRIVVAVLGASDATGEGAEDPGQQNWVAQMTLQLPPSVQVENFGIGGAWLADAAQRQVPRVADLKPDIIVGWLIVNDLVHGVPLAEYEQHLDAILSDLSRLDAQILLGNVPNLWHLPAFVGDAEDVAELRQEVERWNAALEHIANQYGARIIDLSGDTIRTEDLSPDGFHPSTEGHARLADRFRPYVLDAIDRAAAPSTIEVGNETDGRERKN